MKISVKTLKGTRFEIEVNQQDTVADVKKIIEKSQPSGVYPALQQILIHQGKVLKDATTMEENKVAENSFVVIMLSKTKPSTSDASTTSPVKAPPKSVPPPTIPTLSPTPTPAFVASPAPAPPVTSTSPGRDLFWSSDWDELYQAGSHYGGTIQQILDMGGGTWDRGTVVRALRAAFNDPEIAVEYLYSGIPEHLNFQPLARSPEGAQPIDVPSQLQRPSQPTSVPSSGPNANPFDLFPHGLPNVGTGGGVGGGNSDFLRNSPQFNMLQSMLHANPQLLQPMLQELVNQNPNVMRFIDENQSDFLRLMNEPVEGIGGNPLEGLARPQQITVTPQERESMERLEAMGFDRTTVLEVFFACNKIEELAANYLLDNMHDYDD